MSDKPCSAQQSRATSRVSFDKKAVRIRKAPTRESGLSTSIETLADCVKEDKKRARLTRESLPIKGPVSWLNIGTIMKQARVRIPYLPTPPIDVRRAEALIESLDYATEFEVARPTLASSTAMRGVRKRVIGKLLAALEEYPDDALRTFTVLNKNWVFQPEQLSAMSASKLKKQFRTHLQRAGVLEVPGFFVAFLHGEFEPSKGVFVLHYHGVTTSEKAAALSGLKELPGYENTHTGAAPVKRSTVSDRVYQLTYLLKSYWPQKGVRRYSDGKIRRDRRGSRIPGRFQTVYLVWLDQQSLGDMTILSDAWSRRNGGSPAMRKLYLSIYQRRVDE